MTNKEIKAEYLNEAEKRIRKGDFEVEKNPDGQPTTKALLEVARHLQEKAEKEKSPKEMYNRLMDIWMFFSVWMSTVESLKKAIRIMENPKDHVQKENISTGKINAENFPEAMKIINCTVGKLNELIDVKNESTVAFFGEGLRLEYNEILKELKKRGLAQVMTLEEIEA